MVISELATLPILSFTILISFISICIFRPSLNLLDNQKRQRFILLACNLNAVLVLAGLFVRNFVLELLSNSLMILLFLANLHDSFAKLDHFYFINSGYSIDRNQMHNVFLLFYGFFPSTMGIISLTCHIYFKKMYLDWIQGGILVLTLVFLLISDIQTVFKISGLLRPLNGFKSDYEITPVFKSFSGQARAYILIYPLIWVLIALDISNRILGLLADTQVSSLGPLVKIASLSIVHLLIRALLHLTFGADLQDLLVLHQIQEPEVISNNWILPDPRPSGLSRKSFEEYALGLVRQETVKKISRSIIQATIQPLQIVVVNDNGVERVSFSARRESLEMADDNFSYDSSF